MPTAFYVGGLAESNLTEPTFPFRQVWIDPSTLMAGTVGQMRLAANGIDPGEPDGVRLIGNGAPLPYVGLPHAQLVIQLARIGWSVILWPWDWRKLIYPTGQDLARVIRASISPDDPCSIVAHSAGGLVARAAWTDLGTTGDQGLVRRIITMGTPHWGSYAAVDFFSGHNQAIDIMIYWNGTVGYNSMGYAPALFGYQLLGRADYARLGMTWPALYEMMPVLDAPDGIDDHNRPLLYDATNWKGANRPSQAWLDYSRTVTGPWLKSAASMPPPEVLVCVGGNHQSQATALTDPAQLGTGVSTGNYKTGDNTVALASSQLGGSTLYTYGTNHEDWFPQMVANGEIVALLLLDIPPAPPPPPVADDAIVIPQLQPIPGSVLPDFSGSAAARCVGGACSC